MHGVGASLIQRNPNRGKFRRMFLFTTILAEETNMRRSVLLAVAAILSLGVLLPSAAQAGCYRLGETGYHWYRYCFGPSFMYPHHRVCRHGYCWYR